MLMFIASNLVLAGLLFSIYFFYNYLKESGRKLSWWKWALIIVWVVVSYVVLAFIGTAIGEGEPGAALRGGGAFLVVVAICGVVIYRFLISEKKDTKKDDKKIDEALEKSEMVS